MVGSVYGMVEIVPGIIHEYEDALLDCRQAGLAWMLLLDKVYEGMVGIEL